jgi:hypothetical protein
MVLQTATMNFIEHGNLHTLLRIYNLLPVYEMLVCKKYKSLSVWFSKICSFMIYYSQRKFIFSGNCVCLRDGSMEENINSLWNTYTIYMSYKIDPNSQFCLTTYLEPQMRSNYLLKNSIWAQSILKKNSTTWCLQANSLATHTSYLQLQRQHSYLQIPIKNGKCWRLCFE